MVGRGPFQVQYSNGGDSNTYSNQLPLKTESYDIQSIKREPVSQTDVETSNSKFCDYFGWATSSYYHVQGMPHYPVENGIYVSPIEEVGSNPYKMLEQKEESGSISFQKYPDEQNRTTTNNEGASYIPSFAFEGKKEHLMKDDDILDQLTGMFNNDFPYEIHSDDSMVIPVQTPSPVTMVSEPTNQIQTQYQPAEQSPQAVYSPPQSESCNDILPTYSASPDNGCYGSDPLVSLFNEGLSPPNNDLYPMPDSVERPNDDLQILLDEILAVENLPMESNAFGPDNSHHNEIPSLLMSIEEETNDLKSTEVNNDELIPFDTFQFPPPVKKRNSESSMDESPPPSISVSSHFDSHPSPVGSAHSPTDEHETAIPKSPIPKPRLSANLFGQKEDDIIEKLLTPKSRMNNKPVTRDKLVTMNVEDFNALLDKVGLTEIEVAFMKEWRRRGKNKMAAQIARKRKRDELSELHDEIELLRRQKAQLKQSANNLKTTVTSFKRRAQAAEERIYHKYSAAHGLLVSRDTHNIHVTDDGKTMLVPRISSQVLLV